jgi:hypothetical protein
MAWPLWTLPPSGKTGLAAWATEPPASEKANPEREAGERQRKKGDEDTGHIEAYVQCHS